MTEINNRNKKNEEKMTHKKPAPKRSFGRSATAAKSQTNKRSENSGRRSSQKKLKIIPLGGLHEVGKNMTVIEYGSDMIAIDCGMAFPDDEMLGIDVVIPDFTYIEQNAGKLRGIVITHAHEDHIGALPYLLKKLSVPVFATRITAGYIRYKLHEHGIPGNIHDIAAGDSFRLGCFNLEAIHTTHSVADSLAYCIETPIGKILHTGDFKIDYTPVNGEPPNLAKLARLGDEGLLLLMSDSTNALRKGYTPSEKAVSASLSEIFRSQPYRIIIATFSSNIDRVRNITELAHECGRKVAVTGRSMENMVRIAGDLGYFTVPPDTLVDINKIKSYKDSELIIVTTGSQGEPMSALARMASNEHKTVKIKPQDVVILSATPVPGNEKTVSNVTNALMARGATVINNEIAQTHVSGHASSEELKLMLALTRPRYFMPVHGEIRHLIGHAEIARSLGIADENIFRMENGSVLEITKTRAKLAEDKVNAGAVLVDGLGVGDIGSFVLNERRVLSESGLIVLSAVFDRASGELIDGPSLYTKGFVYMKDHGDIIHRAEVYLTELLMQAEIDGLSEAAVKKLLSDSLKKFIYEKINRSPVIVTVFQEV